MELHHIGKRILDSRWNSDRLYIMYKPDCLIIDNEKLKLFDELNNILKEQKSIDIASAYFNIAGFQLVRDAMSGVVKFRLLIGVSPQITASMPDVFQPELQYKQRLREDLESEIFRKDKKETAVSLIRLLNDPNWQVRLYDKGFLHGKAYIFDKLAIVGSSNFTYSGFTSNTELNAVLDEAHATYIKKEWFENLWLDSIDFKNILLNILNESKFGTKEYPPYSVFIKTLYEMQKEDIFFEYDTPSTLPASEVNLANFQDDAVKRIYSRLKSYNGVLIADAVGLGKTWIAKKVIEDFGFYRRQRFLIVCPAGVDDLLWRPELKDIGVSENIIHQEELGKENYDFEQLETRLNFKLKDVSLIVIDESHNFRNPLSNRYENLFTLIEKCGENAAPKILLLTATPMNNTHWDLYFQLMLIARNDKRIFLKEGIFDIERKFRKADKGDIKQLADILQIISIRRTRQYIKDNYPDAKYRDSTGQWVKIKFPERRLFEINYSLNETYQGLYHKIAEKIEKGLNLAYYRLEEYRVTGKKDALELGRMKALGNILQTLLLKRLESSVAAFRKSIQTQIEFLNAFKQVFQEGKVLRRKFYNKYLAYMAEEAEDLDYFLNMFKDNLENVNLTDFDLKRFNSDVDKDIAVFLELKTLVTSIDTVEDAKIVELKKKLLALKTGGKILLFSFYADTVNYLFNALNTDAKFQREFDKKIAMVTGAFSTSRRKEIISAFLTSDTDLLLSTDILSEGQNLQMAQIVINYDLHWNPVRMIQRAGRIDRIGSPFSEIYVHNFYPENELESLLELVKILQGKIEMINETVGLDASVLGETVNPKVFGIIRNLRGSKEQKEDVVTQLEEAQFGGGELFWQPLKDFGLERLSEFCESLPHGIQSGLKVEKSFRGIFFYFKYDADYHLWYMYDALNDEFITNKSTILDFIACRESQPRVIPNNLDIFKIHERARNEIKELFSKGLISARIRTAQGRVEKFMRDMRDELVFIEENYFNDDDTKTDIIKGVLNDIGNISLTKLRMRNLRRIWKNYKLSRNHHVLIAALQEFLQDKGIYDEPESVEYDEKKLMLICAEYVS